MVNGGPTSQAFCLRSHFLLYHAYKVYPELEYIYTDKAETEKN